MPERRYYVRSPDGGKAEIVELPIAHGADVTARDGDGTGALKLARKRDKRALIELLQRDVK